MAAPHSIKGPAPAPTVFPGAGNLRIAIVHARWNMEVIEPLLQGALESLDKAGVKRENVVIESVPGSYELPFACKSIISASQIQASSNASDLMSATGSLLDMSSPGTPTGSTSTKALKRPFDAVIAIGVLIKGSTMHFEYISSAATDGLMRVQLDTGVPVVFGILTALTEDQALERAGVGRGEKKGHNHGLDWGTAAVELACKLNRWSEGKLGAQ